MRSTRNGTKVRKTEPSGSSFFYWTRSKTNAAVEDEAKSPVPRSKQAKTNLITPDTKSILSSWFPFASGSGNATKKLTPAKAGSNAKHKRQSPRAGTRRSPRLSAREGVVVASDRPVPTAGKPRRSKKPQETASAPMSDEELPRAAMQQEGSDDFSSVAADPKRNCRGNSQKPTCQPATGSVSSPTEQRIDKRTRSTRRGHQQVGAGRAPEVEAKPAKSLIASSATTQTKAAKRKATGTGNKRKQSPSSEVPVRVSPRLLQQKQKSAGLLSPQQVDTVTNGNKTSNGDDDAKCSTGSKGAVKKKNTGTDPKTAATGGLIISRSRTDDGSKAHAAPTTQEMDASGWDEGDAQENTAATDESGRVSKVDREAETAGGKVSGTGCLQDPLGKKAAITSCAGNMTSFQIHDVPMPDVLAKPWRPESLSPADADIQAVKTLTVKLVSDVSVATCPSVTAPAPTALDRPAKDPIIEQSQQSFSSALKTTSKKLPASTLGTTKRVLRSKSQAATKESPAPPAGKSQVSPSAKKTLGIFHIGTAGAERRARRSASRRSAKKEAPRLGLFTVDFGSKRTRSGASFGSAETATRSNRTAVSSKSRGRAETPGMMPTRGRSYHKAAKAAKTANTHAAKDSSTSRACGAALPSITITAAASTPANSSVVEGGILTACDGNGKREAVNLGGNLEVALAKVSVLPQNDNVLQSARSPLPIRQPAMVTRSNSRKHPVRQLPATARPLAKHSKRTKKSPAAHDQRDRRSSSSFSESVTQEHDTVTGLSQRRRQGVNQEGNNASVDGSSDTANVATKTRDESATASSAEPERRLSCPSSDQNTNGTGSRQAVQAGAQRDSQSVVDSLKSKNSNEERPRSSVDANGASQLTRSRAVATEHTEVPRAGSADLAQQAKKESEKCLQNGSSTTTKAHHLLGAAQLSEALASGATASGPAVGVTSGIRVGHYASLQPPRQQEMSTKLGSLPRPAGSRVEATAGRAPADSLESLTAMSTDPSPFAIPTRKGLEATPEAERNPLVVLKQDLSPGVGSSAVAECVASLAAAQGGAGRSAEAPEKLVRSLAVKNARISQRPPRNDPGSELRTTPRAESKQTAQSQQIVLGDGSDAHGEDASNASSVSKEGAERTLPSSLEEKRRCDCASVSSATLRSINAAVRSKDKEALSVRDDMAKPPPRSDGEKADTTHSAPSSRLAEPRREDLRPGRPSATDHDRNNVVLSAEGDERGQMLSTLQKSGTTSATKANVTATSLPGPRVPLQSTWISQAVPTALKGGQWVRIVRGRHKGSIGRIRQDSDITAKMVWVCIDNKLGDKKRVMKMSVVVSTPPRQPGRDSEATAIEGVTTGSDDSTDPPESGADNNSGTRTLESETQTLSADAGQEDRARTRGVSRSRSERQTSSTTRRALARSKSESCLGSARQISDQGEDRREECLKVGDDVSITDGKYAGESGKVTGIKQRVKVSIPTLEKEAWLKKEFLVRASTARTDARPVRRMSEQETTATTPLAAAAAASASTRAKNGSRAGRKPTITRGSRDVRNAKHRRRTASKDDKTETPCNRWADGSMFRAPDCHRGGSMVGNRRMVKRRFELAKDNSDPQTVLHHLFLNRLWFVEIPITDTEVEEPIEAVYKQNGSEFVLVASKVQKDGDANSFFNRNATCIRLTYLQVSGRDDHGELEGLPPVARILGWLGNFSELSARKARARMELLQSPIYKFPNVTISLPKHRRGIFWLDPSDFVEIPDEGHEGCGFIDREFLVQLLGGTAAAQRTWSIQVRIFSSDLGIFKGMLTAKHLGRRQIQLPSSMRKVGPSKEEEPAPEWLKINCMAITQQGVFPSKNALSMNRLLQHGPEHLPKSLLAELIKSSTEKLGPRDMITNLLCDGMGVPREVVRDYRESLRTSPDKIGHGYTVGVYHDGIPPGYVYATGLRDVISIFVTRSPCIRATDGCRVLVLTEKPAAMDDDVWEMLQARPFGELFFGPPSPGMKSLPSMIASGDLDGDRYLLIWAKEILSHVTAEPLQEVAVEELEESKPAARDSDWFEAYLKFISDILGLRNEAQLIGRLYRLSERRAAASDQGMKDPDADAFGKAYHKALEYPKHGKPIPLPARLHNELPEALHKYLCDDSVDATDGASQP